MCALNQSPNCVNNISGLTPREARALRFLATYINQNWTAPRFREISEAIGLRSKSRVHIVLDALEAKGFIERRRYRQQAIAILRWPEPRYFHWVRTSPHDGELVAFTPVCSAASLNASEVG